MAWAEAVLQFIGLQPMMCVCISVHAQQQTKCSDGLNNIQGASLKATFSEPLKLLCLSEVTMNLMKALKSMCMAARLCTDHGCIHVHQMTRYLAPSGARDLAPPVPVSGARILSPPATPVVPATPLVPATPVVPAPASPVYASPSPATQEKGILYHAKDSPSPAYVASPVVIPVPASPVYDSPSPAYASPSPATQDKAILYHAKDSPSPSPAYVATPASPEMVSVQASPAYASAASSPPPVLKKIYAPGEHVSPPFLLAAM